MIFATSKANSLLVYNFGKTARGRSDFLSVELVNGHPRLSWGGSGTSITKLFLTNKRVDTGNYKNTYCALKKYDQFQYYYRVD